MFALSCRHFEVLCKCFYLYSHLTSVKFMLPSEHQTLLVSGGDQWVWAADSQGWERSVDRCVMSGTSRYSYFGTNSSRDQYIVKTYSWSLKINTNSILCTSRKAMESSWIICKNILCSWSPLMARTASNAWCRPWQMWLAQGTGLLRGLSGKDEG